jgi:membrane-associated protein
MTDWISNMPAAMFLFLDIFKPESIIEYGGLALLLLVIFAESGLFFAFFLPGDSLLFIAGLLCKSHLQIPVWLLIILIIVSAIAGTLTGFAFGKMARLYMTNKKENFFYKKKYLEITQRFYDRHGMSAFIIGRFLPIVRTFMPILAGIVNINSHRFIKYNILGICLWVISIVSAGHLLGNAFPAIVNYLEIIVIGLILITTFPIVMTWIKSKNNGVLEKR